MGIEGGFVPDLRVLSDWVDLISCDLFDLRLLVGSDNAEGGRSGKFSMKPGCPSPATHAAVDGARREALFAMEEEPGIPYNEDRYVPNEAL